MAFRAVRNQRNARWTRALGEIFHVSLVLPRVELRIIDQPKGFCVTPLLEYPKSFYKLPWGSIN